ncbi:MAG: hypothetical protein IPO83_14045 [Chitinophagaceae bacterium]|nr:hypothetical protein [Chitinophagaceae bacterium]
MSQAKNHVTGFAAAYSKFMDRVTIDQSSTPGKIPNKKSPINFAAKWRIVLLCA